MASPMRMIEAVSHALGVDIATVTTHDRNLVTANLRTKGGRGTSAARMTAKDASNLIIAIAGAEQVRGSAKAVETFGGLVVVGRRAGTPLPKLRSGHTFSEALQALIQSFIDDDFKNSDGIGIEITLTRPLINASIVGYIHDAEVEAHYSQDATGGKQPEGGGDLKTITQFTQVALWQIAIILRN